PQPTNTKRCAQPAFTRCKARRKSATPSRASWAGGKPQNRLRNKRRPPKQRRDRRSSGLQTRGFCVASRKQGGPLALERTFAIIKPDAVGRSLTAEILSRIHAAKFQILAIKSLRLTKSEAEGFYAVHRERPFFKDLTDFMSSGKAVVIVLEAENAIAK